ncbi:MAG: tyrosine-type recombinase/integrase [Proteobacteria bacterium]|nr:tyrosine-type recombinase/integrase [Pseudomonadota bacterium]
MSKADDYRSWVRQAPDDFEGDSRERRADIVNDILEESLPMIEAEHGPIPASRYFRMAIDQKDWTEIDEHLEPYLSEHRAKPHSQWKRRQVINALKDWRRELSVEAIDDNVAREFVDKVIAPNARPATINGKLGDLSGYWRWMIKRGRVPKTVTNPWPDQRRKPERKPPEEIERAFSDDEMRSLFYGTKKPRPDLADIMLLGAFTGARLDELARLKVKDVGLETGRLHIPGTKTAAAQRRIPLHPALLPMLKHRVTGKKDSSWVFHELPTRKPDDLKPRSSPLSKAFTRFRRSVGVGGTHGRDSPVDFHSFRRWLSSQLTHFGASEDLVGRICGWEGDSMLRRYTWSADTFELARQYLEKVALPADTH